MKNELFHIGPLTIYGYGLMIAIGIMIAYSVINYRGKKKEMDLSHISSLTTWGLVGGFVGAKLLYWITDLHNIINDPGILLDVTSGFVVYGGIIGGIFAGYLYCKRKNISFLKYLDLFAPSIALAQGFGRIGCLLAGCCYGEETHSWLGIVFHESEFAPNDVRLIPTQIFESVFNFTMFFVLIYVAKRKRTEGLIACLYLILYGIGRFIIEFYRGDIIRGHVGVLSTSQLIALFVVLFTCIIMLVNYYRRSKKL